MEVAKPSMATVDPEEQLIVPKVGVKSGERREYGKSYQPHDHRNPQKL